MGASHSVTASAAQAEDVDAFVASLDRRDGPPLVLVMRIAIFADLLVLQISVER